VNSDAATLAEAVDKLEMDFPGIKERIVDEQGEIRRFVNIYINGEDVRFLDNINTALKQGDEVSIVPAVAGGM
jgi:MoaD family protein